MRERIPGTVRGWRGSTVYPGLTPGSPEYRRQATIVARRRRIQRLGLAEVLRLEREAQARWRARQRAKGLTPASVIRARMIRILGLEEYRWYENARCNARRRKQRRKAAEAARAASG